MCIDASKMWEEREREEKQNVSYMLHLTGID